MNQKAKLWTKDFIIISATNFLLFISFYLLMTTMTVYSIKHFHASQSEAGLASSIFVLGAVFVRPIAGKTIDTIGRKKMLYFALGLFVIMTVLYFPINSLPLLLLVRFIHGFSFGIATTATGTIVADLIPQSRRGEGMGYFAMSMNIAMALGPFLGLVISQNLNDTMVFVITTILAALSVVAVFFLQVKNGKRLKVSSEIKNGFQLSDYFEKNTVPISILAAVCGLIYSSILSFLTAYAIEIDLVDAASFFFVMYAVFLVISRPFTGKLFDLKGENSVMYPTIFLFGIGFILLGLSHHGISMLIAGAIIGVGFGTFQSSAQTIAIQVAPRERIGLATSTYFVFFDLGTGLGPFLLGKIVPITGFRFLYVAMGVLAFLCMFIYYLVHGKKSTEQKQALNMAMAQKSGE